MTSKEAVESKNVIELPFWSKETEKNNKMINNETKMAQKFAPKTENFLIGFFTKWANIFGPIIPKLLQIPIGHGVPL